MHQSYTPQIRSDFGTTRCIDIEGGYTFWEPVPAKACEFTLYSTLYKGYADKITDNINDHPQVAYSVTTQDTVFALTSTDKYTACGRTLIQTGHPKLVIFETLPETGIAKRRIANLDIFT